MLKINKKILPLLLAASLTLTGCQKVEEMVEQSAEATTTTPTETTTAPPPPESTPPVFGDPQVGGSAILSKVQEGGYTATLEIVGITALPDNNKKYYSGEYSYVKLTDKDGKEYWSPVYNELEGGVWESCAAGALKFLKVEQDGEEQYILMLRCAFGDEVKGYDYEEDTYRTVFFPCGTEESPASTSNSDAPEAAAEEATDETTEKTAEKTSDETEDKPFDLFEGMEQLTPYEIAPCFFVQDSPAIDLSDGFTYKKGTTFVDEKTGIKLTFNTLTHTAVALKYFPPEEGKDDPDDNDVLLDHYTPTQISFLNSCVFLGDSTCSGVGLYGFVPRKNCYGIVGGAARNIYDFTVEVDGVDYDPVEAMEKNGRENLVFLMGMNDVNMVSADQYEEYYEAILTDAETRCPYANLYILSVSPVTVASTFCYNSSLDRLNDRLIKLADEKPNRHYINTSDALKNGGEGMDPYYATDDGIHMMSYAYYVILDQLCEQAGIK